MKKYDQNYLKTVHNRINRIFDNLASFKDTLKRRRYVFKGTR